MPRCPPWPLTSTRPGSWPGWVWVSVRILTRRSSATGGGAESIAELGGRVRDPWHAGLGRRHLGQEEVRPVGCQHASYRSRHRLRVVHGGHRAVAGSRGDGVEPRVARRRRLIAGGPVHLVVEDAMDEVPRGQRRDV